MRAVLLAAVLVLAPAAVARADDGLLLGSKPGERVEGSLALWLAALKKTSDFGFSVPENGRRAPRYVQDLGFPEEQTALVASASVKLGIAGWVGTEWTWLGYRNAIGQVSRPRQVDHYELARGDVTETSASWLWGRLHYGWEVRYRFLPWEDVPLDVFVSPTLGVGMYHLDVRVRRLFPTVSPELGGDQTKFVVAPGARLGVEVWDAVKLGLDLEWLPNLGEEWERVRAYLAVRLFGVEASIGYRYVNTSAKTAGDTSDVKLRGVDFALGFRF